jgi:hypothetical protein
MECLLLDFAGHEEQRNLVRSLGAGDAFVDGLAAREAFSRAVPVSNRGLAHLPAEQHDAAFDDARKIEQADVDIFDLHADGIDFGERIFGPLFGLGAFGFAPRNGHNINMRATVEKDAMGQRLHFGLDLFHEFLATDGRAQKRFEHRKKRVGFVEIESSVGHSGYFYSNANGKAAVSN